MRHAVPTVAIKSNVEDHCKANTPKQIGLHIRLSNEARQGGHLIRHNSSQLQLIEGKIEGRRSRGRPRNTWITDITATNGMKYYQLKRAAEDKKRWHGLVINLAQQRTLR